jgi:hypothetical protein
MAMDGMAAEHQAWSQVLLRYYWMTIGSASKKNRHSNGVTGQEMREETGVGAGF